MAPERVSFPNSGAIGRVESVVGKAWIVRADGTRILVESGTPLFRGDIIASEADAAAGLRLIDGAAVSLGENTRTVLDEVIFDESTQDGSISLFLVYGEMLFEGGSISNLAPSVTISSPSARFRLFRSFAAFEIDASGKTVASLIESGNGESGSISVANNAGQQVLKESLSQISILGPDTAPGEPSPIDWSGMRTRLAAVIDILPESLGRTGLPDRMPDQRLWPEAYVESQPDPQGARAGEKDFEPAAGPQSSDGSDVPHIRVAAETLETKNEVQDFDLPVPPASLAETETAPSRQDLRPAGADTDDEVATSFESNETPLANDASVTAREDEAVAGRLAASDVDRDALSFALAPGGAPAHGVVTVNRDGSYSYEPNSNYSGSDKFSFLVTDEHGATSLGHVAIEIAPVADTPTLIVGDVVGSEDTAIPLSLNASLPDASEILSLTVSGVPAGARLSAGIDNRDGTWTLAADQLDGLTLTPAANESGEIVLSVSATSTVPETGEAATTSALALVIINPVSDIPFLGLEPTTRGAEDASVPLTINAYAVDLSETVTVQIAGLPNGARLSAGIDLGGGVWSVDAAELANLRLTPAPDFAEPFRLEVKAISSDPGSDRAASIIDTIDVSMTPSGDISLSSNSMARDETDTPVFLSLGLSPSITDADASETLSRVVVTFSHDLPVGTTVAGGTLEGRTLTIPGENISNVAVIVPADWAGSLTGSAVAYTNEGASQPTPVSLSVAAVADQPNLSIAITPREAEIAASRGGYISVWEDPNLDGSSTSIIARRFDADGRAKGSEFIVNTTTAGAQANPASATLSDGSFVIAWESANLDGSQTGIAMQRYYASGKLAGAERLVNEFQTGSQNNPQVLPLKDGGFVVAWDGRGADDTAGIMVRRFDANGGPVGGEVRANATTSGGQDTPALCALADGGYVVTWDGSGPSDTSGVYGRRFDATGVPVGAEFRANVTTSQTQDLANVAGLPDGGFVVAWHGRGASDTDAIYMRRYNADGQAASGETLVNSTTTGTQTRPSLVGLDDGSFVIVWDGRGADDTTGIWGQRFTANCVRLGSEFRVNSTTSNTQDLPIVTALSDGGFLVNWQSSGQDGSNQGVFGQRFGHDGARVGDEFQVNATTQGSQADPAAVGLDVGPNYFDVEVRAAFGDVEDSSEQHRVRVDVPDGFSLMSDPTTWTDLPSGVSASLVEDDVVFTVATGTAGLDSFSYSFSVVQDDLTVGDPSFSAQAEATEIGNGGFAVTIEQADTLIGTAEADVLTGSSGAEMIFSGAENDVIDGGSGDDSVFGGDGDDTISGGAGEDMIAGGAGDDVLTGGDGADTFAIDVTENSPSMDSITDFSPGDEIRLEGGTFGADDVVITQRGDDAVITIGGHENEIIVDDVDASQLVSYQLTPDPQSSVIVGYLDKLDKPGT